MKKTQKQMTMLGEVMSLLTIPFYFVLLSLIISNNSLSSVSKRDVIPKRRKMNVSGERPNEKIESVGERKKIHATKKLTDQNLADLCQSWFIAGKNLGYYTAKLENYTLYKKYPF